MVKSYKRIDGLDEMGWMGWVWNSRRGPYRYFRKYLKAPLLSAPLCGANNNDNNHDCHYNHHHDHQNRDYHDPPPSEPPAHEARVGSAPGKPNGQVKVYQTEIL